MTMAQWRVGIRRSGALVALIAAAVAAFTLLTSAATAERLDAVGTVVANYRPAYDILVRPTGTRLPLEQQRNLVQSGQLAGMNGGITLDQWTAVQQIDGVAVAAPVAVVGYSMRTVPVEVDLTSQLDPAAERQVLRIQPTWVTDAGLSAIPDGAAYLYVTRNPLRQPPPTKYVGQLIGPREHSDGTAVLVCADGEGAGISPLAGPARSSLTCIGGPGSTGYDGRPVTAAPVLRLGWSIPFLIAAVDPVAEAALARVDAAVTSGRYFTDGEGPRPYSFPEPLSNPPVLSYDGVPILMADRPQVDTALRLDTQRLGPAAVRTLRTVADQNQVRTELDALPGATVDQRQVDLQEIYPGFVDRIRDPATYSGDYIYGDGVHSSTPLLGTYWTVGPARLLPDGDGLRAETVAQDPKIWGTGSSSGDIAHSVPMELADIGVRGGIAVHQGLDRQPTVVGRTSLPDVGLQLIGTFDPAKVDIGGALSAVPMDTYFNPGVTGADDASRRALRGATLRPNANLAGLLSQPPLMLTTIASLPRLLGEEDFNTHPAYPEYQLRPDAPISVIRVRLAGDLSIDPVSREKVRLTAARIAERTGLQVDITLGSSPTAVPVAYPEGRYGRPALTVAQPWVRKGVAVVLVSAIDRKSLLLSVLVLTVCGLAVLNAATAAMRTRRLELAILSCLGWPRRKILSLLLLEAAGSGLAAGMLGTALAVGGITLFGMPTDWRHATLATPAALALTLVATLWPAWRATRPDPAAAVRPPVSLSLRRSRAPRRISGLALANLSRTPGRTLLGAAGIAIGVSALTVLLAITFAFHGAVTGTLLGEAVSLQARTVDYLSVAVTVLLGVATTADLVYLNLQDRSAEIALLSAVGWPERLLHRLVAIEAVGIGVLGGVAGAGLGLGAAGWFVGHVTAPLTWCAVTALLTGIAVSGLSVLVPMAVLRRLPTAQLLAEE
ncbi:FtsX-like permease family protein [Catellatospora sp. NPDC049609]|uniref:FtsX-like permease family protein n=1 Tax=Catellatospora sp. NPDC049609 TaxID=3155505 RepID=UPI00341E5087